MIFYQKIFKLIFRSLHLWGFLCIKDAGRTGNKITVAIKFANISKNLFHISSFNLQNMDIDVCKKVALKHTNKTV